MSTVQESIETIKDLGSNGYDAARQLGELNLRSVEMILNRQMDAVSMAMEAGMRQISLVSEAKGYKDLVEGQVELARDVGERMMEVGRENAKLAGDARDEYRVWFEKGLETVTEKVSRLQPTL